MKRKHWSGLATFVCVQDTLALSVSCTASDATTGTCEWWRRISRCFAASAVLRPRQAAVEDSKVRIENRFVFLCDQPLFGGTYCGLEPLAFRSSDSLVLYGHTDRKRLPIQL